MSSTASNNERNASKSSYPVIKYGVDGKSACQVGAGEISYPSNYDGNGESGSHSSPENDAGSYAVQDYIVYPASDPITSAQAVQRPWISKVLPPPFIPKFERGRLTPSNPPARTSRSHITPTDDQITQLGNTIQKLRVQVERQAYAIRAKDAEIVRQNRTIGTQYTIERQKQELKDGFARIKRRIQDMTRENQELKDRIAQVTRERDALKAALQTKQDLYKNLPSSAAQDAKVKILDEKLKTADKKISEMEQTLELQHRPIEVATGIRTRFLNTAPFGSLMFRFIQDMGNSAAHRGNVLVDADLYYMEHLNDFDWFEEAYGFSIEPYLGSPEALRRLGQSKQDVDIWNLRASLVTDHRLAFANKVYPEPIQNFLELEQGCSEIRDRHRKACRNCTVDKVCQKYEDRDVETKLQEMRAIVQQMRSERRKLESSQGNVDYIAAESSRPMTAMSWRSQSGAAEPLGRPQTPE